MKSQSKPARITTLLRILAEVAKAKLFGREVQTSRIVERVLDLGGVYVKFLQVLAVRNINVLSLDNNGIESINQVYDQVAVEHINVHQLLIRELGSKIDTIAKLELQPFAAGSFGQVYRAELNTGETVVIKVIRPSLIKTIRFDLRLLGSLVTLASWFNSSAYDVRKLFGQFAEVTKREIDYRLEAEYGSILYKKYQHHAHIVIPKTYTELSNRHVIVQQKIDGLAVTELITLKQQGVDPLAYVAEHLGSDLNTQLMYLGQDQLASMLVDGHAHGDPHPGNIILLPENKLALIDFGIRSRVPKDRKAFFGLVKEYQKIYAGRFDFENYTLSMMNLFVSELYDAVRAFDMYSGGVASRRLVEAIKSAVGDLYRGADKDISQLISQHKYLLIFSSVINQDNRFGLKFETKEPEFLRATIMYMNLVESLVDKEYVMNQVYTSVVESFRTYEFPTIARHTSPEQALEVVSGWLDTIASRDIYLFTMLTSRMNRRLLGV